MSGIGVVRITTPGVQSFKTLIVGNGKKRHTCTLPGLPWPNQGGQHNELDGLTKPNLTKALGNHREIILSVKAQASWSQQQISTARGAGIWW